MLNEEAIRNWEKPRTSVVSVVSEKTGTGQSAKGLTSTKKSKTSSKVKSKETVKSKSKSKSQVKSANSTYGKLDTSCANSQPISKRKNSAEKRPFANTKKTARAERSDEQEKARTMISKISEKLCNTKHPLLTLIVCITIAIILANILFGIGKIMIYCTAFIGGAYGVYWLWRKWRSRSRVSSVSSRQSRQTSLRKER